MYVNRTSIQTTYIDSHAPIKLCNTPSMEQVQKSLQKCILEEIYKRCTIDGCTKLNLLGWRNVSEAWDGGRRHSTVSRDALTPINFCVEECNGGNGAKI